MKLTSTPEKQHRVKTHAAFSHFGGGYCLTFPESNYRVVWRLDIDERHFCFEFLPEEAEKLGLMLLKYAEQTRRLNEERIKERA